MRLKIPFVGPAYQARSLNVDAQRAVNCYLETDATSNRAPVALYGTPGMILRATLGTSPVRACINEGGYAWWVAGNTVYRMAPNYAVTTVGTITSSTGDIGIASNGTQIIIVDGIGGWIVTVATATIAQITDPDFPNGVTRAQFQDGFFIVAGDGSDKFYINEVTYSGTQWNGLDFDSAAGSPDVTIGLISDHRELWLFGSDSAEIFVSGNADFPFERSGNTFLEAGCASGATVAKADNTVFWLGTDDRGVGIVWRANGYTPERISNHALEKAIQGYSINQAKAFTYQQEGHLFYVLNFPEATWVHDVSTREWHERAWMDPGTGNLSRWRADCHVVFNNVHLVGDYQSGKVYQLDLDTYTDDGNLIKRIRTTTSTEQQQLRVFWSSLQVDMETGVGLSTGQGSDPLLMLRFSDDGGHTWSNLRTGSVGKIGEYGRRVKFNRLGVGRNRVYEISMTDPVKFAVLGAVAEAEAGTS